MMSAKMRRIVERRIASAFIREALRKRYKISVGQYGDDSNGPSAVTGNVEELLFNVEELLFPHDNIKSVLGEMFKTDEEFLFVYRSNEIIPFGWAWFVYNNDGWDVISDYTTNIEELMTGWVSKLQVRYGE